MNKFVSKLVLYRRRIAQFFGVLGLLAGITMFCYENSFISYPENPDPASGRTVEYVVKYNLIRYVTPSEAFIGHVSHYVLFISGIIFALLVLFEMKKKGIWFRSDQ